MKSLAPFAEYAADIVQSDRLPLSTWVVAPTFTSARAASFRPEVEISGLNTRVLAEQAAAVDPGRLGNSVGFLSFDEMRRVIGSQPQICTSHYQLSREKMKAEVCW